MDDILSTIYARFDRATIVERESYSDRSFLDRKEIPGKLRWPMNHDRRVNR